MDNIITQIKHLFKAITRENVTRLEIEARLVDIQDLLDTLKTMTPEMNQTQLHIYHPFNLYCVVAINNIKSGLT